MTPATCFDCGYDLRGLPADARCPECGTPADESARRHAGLQRHGSPKLLRRAVWAVLVPLAAVVGLYAALAVVFAVVGLNSGLDRFVPVFFAAVLLLTLLGVGGMWLASRWLRRDPPASGRLNRRALAAAGWATAGLTVAGWLLVLGLWADPPSRPADAERIASFLAWSLSISAGVFPMLYLGEVRRRVELWPHWPWLPRTLGVLSAALWIAAVLLAVPAALDALGYGPWTYDARGRVYGRSQTLFMYEEVFRLARLIGGVGYALGLLAMAAMLAVTLIGLRRLRRGDVA